MVSPPGHLPGVCDEEVSSSKATALVLRAMFERFTDRARRSVVLAQEEARMLNHNYIGTEHLLLGIIHEGEGAGARAVESLGIPLEAVRQQVEEIIGKGGSPAGGHISFTPRAKKVLELSLREALQLGHNYIGTEHILLGLVREGEGVAAQVLQKLGLDLKRVREQVIQVLAGGGGEVSEEPADPPLCPRCQAPLKETIAYGVLDVRTPEGEEGRAVQFVFCQRCGTWLGTIPPA